MLDIEIIKENLQKYEDIIWMNEYTNDICIKHGNKFDKNIVKEWEKSDRYNELIKKYDKLELFGESEEDLWINYGKLIALKFVVEGEWIKLDDFFNKTLEKYRTEE